MKTLVVVVHPEIGKSVINKRWLEELKKHPDSYTIHELYKEYPDEKIDVEREQRLIESHGNLILQFPVYWFNCPPLLKKWLDVVFTHGWAYGSNGGDKLKDRKVALAVSVGIKEEDYCETGRYLYTLKQLLSPFEITFRYTNADYRSFFPFYGAEYEPSSETLKKSSEAYLEFLKAL
jgi:putative NADPH-quinone reductase